LKAVVSGLMSERGSVEEFRIEKLILFGELELSLKI
jgi:hypothetical protein